MDYESVKYVEGFVENIIFRNEDNGYTVFNIVYDDDCLLYTSDAADEL